MFQSKVLIQRKHYSVIYYQVSSIFCNSSIVFMSSILHAISIYARVQAHYDEITLNTLGNISVRAEQISSLQRLEFLVGNINFSFL